MFGSLASTKILHLADSQKLAHFLRVHGLRPDKKFGQNFLVDEKVLAAIVAAATLRSTDLVVEIGAGLGTLTQAIAAIANRVIALEYDTKIFPKLQKNLANRPHVALQNLDVRRFTPPREPYKLVANIPYYLTSPILRQFLVETVDRPEVVVLLIQKEVAEKICAVDSLSILALQVRVFGQPEIICRVPRGSFLPPPAVDSAVLRITPDVSPKIPSDKLADFFRLVHAGFAAPRKKIVASLALGLRSNKTKVFDYLAVAGINANLRPEKLSLTDWQNLLTVLRAGERQF